MLRPPDLVDTMGDPASDANKWRGCLDMLGDLKKR